MIILWKYHISQIVIVNSKFEAILGYKYLQHVMYIIIAFLILVSVNIALLIFFMRKLHIDWNLYVQAFLYGILVALLIKGFVYGIWKEMNMDFYFFEVRILGKNALENFENSYLHFIESLSIQYTIFYTIGVIILPAILEEVGKFWALRFIASKKNIWFYSTIRTYIYQMLIIALWFSFIENIFYLLHFLEMGQYGTTLIQLIILRILVSTTSHLLFSWILAYFYARFVFWKYDLIDTWGFNMHKKIVSLLKTFHLYYSSLFLIAYRWRLLLLGFILSISFHIIYNLLIYLEYPIFAIGWLGIWWWIFYRFILSGHLVDKNLGLIQEKISIIKEMRNIQKRKDAITEENEKA